MWNRSLGWFRAASSMFALVLLGCGAQRHCVEIVWPPPVPAEIGAVPRVENPPWAWRGAQTYHVTMVEKATQRPLPGAELLYMPASIDRSRLTFAERIHGSRLRQGDPEAHLLRYGAVAHADEQGHLELTLAEAPGWSIARHGALRAWVLLWGELQTDDKLPTELRVELAEPPTFEAQVVDGSGDPVPGVELYACFGGDRGSSCSSYTDNAEARVTIHPPLGAESGAEDWNRVRIRPLMGGLVVEGVEVDILDPPPQPVRVVCPPFGRLLVRVAEDQAVFGAQLSPLVLLTASAAEQGPLGGFAEGQALVGTALPDGSFLFPFVALNQRYATVPLGVLTRMNRRQDFPGGLAPQAFDGPRASGETVEVELRPDLEAPLLTAVVLDDERVARADVLLQIEMDVGVPFEVDGQAAVSEQRKRFRVRTDAQGRFGLPLPPYLEGVRPKSTLIRVLDRFGWDYGPARLVGCTEFRRGERVDLGPVLVTRPPRLVTLMIRNSRGEPMGFRDHSDHLEVLRKDATGAEVWEELRPEYLDPRPDGAVAVHSHCRERRWRIRFYDRGYPEVDRATFAPTTEFEAGAERVEIQGRRPW